MMPMRIVIVALAIIGLWGMDCLGNDCRVTDAFWSEARYQGHVIRMEAAELVGWN